MRDFASCFSEYAIQVASDASCSSYSNHSCISPNLVPSIQNATTCVYKIQLSTKKHLLITATWTKNNQAQGLTINFGENPLTSFKLVTNSRGFRKKKGLKSFEFENSKFEIFWDLSSARYDSSPEPIDGYYILVLVDSELALASGDLSKEAISKRLKQGTKTAKSSLISIRENFSGNTLYATRAQFSDSGDKHDIVIRCSRDNGGLKCPVLTVCIDKKPVICVKRLQWNFRGNQSIFVDGLLVDLMWDVHDWFYIPVSGSGSGLASGSAVFMFRTRSGIDNRLWLEEKLVQKDQDKVEFSLLIHACKTP